MRSIPSTFRALLGLLVCAALQAQEGEWPRFRGPNGAGCSPHPVPLEWNDSTTRWTIELPGTGHGSPVVWGDCIFLLAGDEKTGTRIPLAVNRGDGAILWQHSVAAGDSKKHRFNSVASTTPAADARHVYFSWGTKEKLSLVAYTHAGEPVWERDLGGVVGGHGFGGSPTVVGDLVILNNDQDKASGSLLALDAETGETRWEVPRKGQRLSYSVPVLFEHGDVRALIFTNWQHGFTAVDPATGTVLAEKSAFDTTTNERAISSPIQCGELTIGTCGFTSNPKHCVAMKFDGKEFTEVWRIEKSVPHIPSVLAHEGLVFLWGDGGIVTCVDGITGESLWRERVPGSTYMGSPVLAGDALIAIDVDGKAVAIRAGRTFEILAENELGELFRSTPAAVDGTLYLRTFSKLTAIGE